MKQIDGFPVISWEELKSKILALPKATNDISLNDATVIENHDLFIQSHIEQIDAGPYKKNLTPKEMAYRISCVKPAYERMLKYYYLRIKLIEA